MIIQDWTWPQVPPPVLAVEPHARAAEHLHERAAAMHGSSLTSDGEDVPARLDAAADACEPYVSGSADRSAAQAQRHLRRAGDWLNAAAPVVRAGVAAALARPTERQG